jgi:hypothetical protein
MLAEVRLLIAAREARLMLINGGEVIDDEIWKFDAKVSSSEAAEAARVSFDDLYDFMNAVVNE